MKKKILPILGVLLSITAAGGLTTACNNNSESSTSVSSAKIQISSNVKEVAVGSTITLRVLVTGTASRDVTWSSADTTIATISSKGVVTGIRAGKVKMTATLNSDTNVKVSVEITVFEAVAPTSISVTGDASRTAWLKEDIELEYTLEPSQADKRVTFTSSDENVATVSTAGVISFKQLGNVSITVKSAVNADVSSTVAFTVKDGPFWTNRGGYADGMDYSHQADATNPYLQTNFTCKEGTDAMNPSIAWFKVEGSTRFYAEATVGYIASTSDAWTRIGIGTATNDTNTRAFYYCDKEGRKTTVLDFPVGFGGNQNQSTVWQVNGLGKLNKKAFKLGILRDGNKYYYTINDKLYWVEINKRFNETPSWPIIIGMTCTYTIKNAFSTLDTTYINNKFAQETYSDKWYPGSTMGNVTYTKSTDTWSFLNTQREGGNTVHISQQAAKPYGDAALAENNFELEYDLSNFTTYADNPFSYAGVVLRRYDTWTDNFGSDMETFVTNKTGYFYRVWGSDKTFHESTKLDYTAVNYTTPLADGTHHIKITRTVNEATSLFKITVDGTPVKWNVDGAQVEELPVAFVGKYLVHFGANDAIANISNFTITNK